MASGKSEPLFEDVDDLDNTDIWLIRKPRDIKVADLQDNLNLVKKIKGSNCESRIATSRGLLDVRLERMAPAFYFRVPESVQTAKENMKIPIKKLAHKMATLRHHREIPDLFPGAIEEDFGVDLDVTMKNEPDVDLPFERIRRKPTTAPGPIEHRVPGSSRKEKDEDSAEIIVENGVAELNSLPNGNHKAHKESDITEVEEVGEVQISEKKRRRRNSSIKAETSQNGGSPPRKRHKAKTEDD